MFLEVYIEVQMHVLLINIQEPTDVLSQKLGYKIHQSYFSIVLEVTALTMYLP